jgi:YVTN family beta-propeller protein
MSILPCGRFLSTLGLVLGVCYSQLFVAVAGDPARTNALAPTALAATLDHKSLFIACFAAGQVQEFNLATGKVVRRIAVPAAPSGLAVSRDGRLLFVTCAAPESQVCMVDIQTGQIIATMSAGHTALSPVLSPDGRRLYVCNRFEDSVSFFDVVRKQEIVRVRVVREPMAAALTPDGKRLLVANSLHRGRADADFVAAVVSVIDTDRRKLAGEILLPNGSGLLRGISISPDGRYACVTHLVARYQLPTTQLDRGWINNNAVTLIDIAQMKRWNTVLLDTIDRGAGNPWATAWSGDGRWLCVSHAGTHEISVIDFPALVQKLGRLSEKAAPIETRQPNVEPPFEASNDLSVLAGLRQRVPLDGNGPRSLAVVANQVWVAHYFSDSLSSVELMPPQYPRNEFALGSATGMSSIRRGERLFNDATVCFQGWESCASCHAEDGRVDALNWDLLNDGIGTPKDAKSMLLAHQTPPSMSIGVRENAAAAVRAGIRNSLFSTLPEADASAMDDYLKSLQPIPSPHLVKGRLSAEAERGRKIFLDPAVGCSTCHPPGLYTDKNSYNVGTKGRYRRDQEAFDTPTLVEIWRTAPYLHDGSAPTVRDVITTRNPKDQHGCTSHLKPGQRDDLVAFLLSL